LRGWFLPWLLEITTVKPPNHQKIFKPIFFWKGGRRSLGGGALIEEQPTHVGERSLGCPPSKPTCDLILLTGINMWCGY